MQYILSVLAMIAGFFLLFFLGWLFCRLFIWEAYDPLYRFLKAMEDTVIFWGSALILVGMFLLAYRYISKPLAYLDEVIAAAEGLAQPDETPIRLSAPMESIQDELNVVREGALRNAAYAREAEQRNVKLALNTGISGIVCEHGSFLVKTEGLSLQRISHLEDIM